MAYDLNQPMDAIPVNSQQGTLPNQYSLAQISEPNIILETVKEAETGDAMIFRMYDAYGSHKKNVEIIFGFNVTRVCLCSMMEDDFQELTLNGNSVNLIIKPFEIITLKVYPGR